MKFTEYDYIKMGHAYEYSLTKGNTLAISERIRFMLQQESVDDQSEARYLIATGRKEIIQQQRG
jgi:hypothetical protein